MNKGGRISPIEERFYAGFVRVPSGCWVWNKSKNRGGYGVMSINGRPVSAHRVSWEIYRGSIPQDMYVCHHCDSPPCVNPAHLFLGTAKDNSKDCSSKGRFAKGRNARLSKLHRHQLPTSVRLSEEQRGFLQKVAREQKHSNLSMVIKLMIQREMEVANESNNRTD